MSGATAAGVLVEPISAGRVRHCEQNYKTLGGWESTDGEFHRLREDIDLA